MTRALPDDTIELEDDEDEEEEEDEKGIEFTDKVVAASRESVRSACVALSLS